jgi:rare lipoprotein A
MKKYITYLLLFFSTLLIFSSFDKNYLIKKQEPKKATQDTVKKAVTKEEVDTIITYKGKFKPYKKGAHASYYGDRFHGRRTASGKKFDMYKLTAAHKKLPFGTMVKVTNEANGKSVVVEITDRGPFVRGREIDLSKKAFYTISKTSGAGYIKATLEVLQK